MPFQKVETSAVDFPALERDVLRFWDDHGIFEQRKQLNAGKPKWRFLDGPITANNPMGVHHAWNRTYKDAFNRYFAMTGHDLRYQQGFDCQGLWVEVEVEKELRLRSKRDIEELVPGDPAASIDRFVQACKDRVNHFARVQTNQSIRLGYWMNWDRTDADWQKRPDDRHSYFTMSESNNYAIWDFLKRCHHRKWVYRGYDVMPWCGRCGVGISEQEMKEGYKLIEHRACFVKLPLLDRPGENLLVWTTTPWTLTSNVGAAINPKLTYLAVKLKGEVYYLAKGTFKQDRMAGGGDDEALSREAQPSAKRSRREWLDGVPHLSSLEQLFKSKAGKGETYEIVGELPGEQMLGWRYAGPFDDLPAQNHEYGFPDEVARVTKQQGWCPPVTGASAHRVVDGGDDVTEGEGTGIVHTAPGCGGIDYLWGKANGLPAVAPIGDDGVFHAGFGPLTGKNATDPATADAVFEELKKKDRLFAVERYVHRYPHCWRCKTELLYRLVDEWFINMGPRNTEDGFRGDIMQVVDKVTFLPESINGRARERDWLWNMGDWMISKKRFWGLALPIWVDEADPTDFEVIGSYEELRERAVEGWQEFDGHTPHRPWVDKVVIKNPRTGNRMHRVPDVGNPWLDAGIVAFSTLHYKERPDFWRQWYPADFITESFPGQFRNWFYALLAMSTLMGDGEPPFRTLLGFATVQDQFGRPMHKSDGNSIEFVGAADDGFELFRDIDPKKDAKEALKELPKGHLAVREEAVEVKGQPMKRVAAKYKPIGADVIRWLFCRQPPAANLNFGPEPTDEVRAKFVIKLWNCYAFFANYAVADGFDPASEPVPVAARPDVDRWILSDLQGLIGTARVSFERYDVAAFCATTEAFIDEKLSNWYIRRNRGRFHSRNQDLDAAGLADKRAAYQTLYTVLTTVCRLIAPCVPFVSEVMWRNLRTDRDPASVHLCDYPAADPALVDAELSADVDAVLRIVSLGGACRNAAKQKVRQPLAELKVQPAGDADRRAVERFASTIADELNVKAVTLHDQHQPKRVGETQLPDGRTVPHMKRVGDLLEVTHKLNKKLAAPKLGSRLAEVERSVQKYHDNISSWLLNPSTGLPILDDLGLEPSDLSHEYTAPAGWAGVVDRGTQVAIDGRVTPELKREGLSRDVIRLVQEERKNAKLDMLDKIALHLGAAGELAAAVEAHRAAIGTAVQAVEWLPEPPAGGHTAGVTVEGQPLTIGLRKA